MIYIGSSRPTSVYLGNNKVSAIYLGTTKVFPNGNNVTYVWNGNQTVEYVDYGSSILNPSFKPQRSNYTFIGWSNSISSTTILTNEVMGDNPITLYAVWQCPNTTLLSEERIFYVSGQETILSIDTNKYGSVEVEAYLARMDVGKWEISTRAYAYINNVLVREVWWNDSLWDNNQRENEDLVGSYGKTFSINVNFNANSGLQDLYCKTTGSLFETATFVIKKVVGGGRVTG